MPTDLEPRERPGWTGKLWGDIEDVYASILSHPFLQGLAAGDLPADAFRYFISQDGNYVREFGKAIALLGGKAPTMGLTNFLVQHVAKGLLAESSLHEALLVELGTDPATLASVPSSPTTLAYTSYVTSTVHQGDFAAGLAVIMPCVWIYAEVGRHLVTVGSPNPVYQRWIDTYAGEDYHEECQEALGWTDLVGAGLTDEQEQRARRHFAVAARYEWMFWDAAYRLEQWPV